ncbi:MAG: methyltransferase domain-containing protein [Bacteroidales bacterium]|jgi:SAM-dependent methyltransferase|nr:methyltransferase domain-containing protein [Bacteroidales bacterium]
MQSQQVPEIYNRLADEYDERYSDLNSRYENMLVGKILEEAGCLGDVLDIGCGTGLFFELYENADIVYNSYMGIDPSIEMLNQMARKYHGHIDYDSNCLTAEGLVDVSRFNTVISLFGAISYVDPSFIRRIKDSKSYVLMFYKEGYRPDYLPDSVKTYSAKDSGLTPSITLNNFEIVIL